MQSFANQIWQEMKRKRESFYFSYIRLLSSETMYKKSSINHRIVIEFLIKRVTQL